MRGWRQLPFSWRARLLAWPGALTFLSLLAVFLGAQQHQPDPQPRLTAAPVAPALPELRALPQPSAPVPLVGGSAPEPYRLPASPDQFVVLAGVWDFVGVGPELTWWGRRQMDGG